MEELKQKLAELNKKVNNIKDSINTEEATKNAFIMPFIQILGYDVFNPTEFVPEFTADIGTKKGEKVDYAILRDGTPLLIIECKHWRETLDRHNSQLHRYFAVTKTRFSLLTNGIEYLFFTDLEKSNVMDKNAFLKINLNELKDNNIRELLKFQKNDFDIESILSSASSLKYIESIKNEFEKEIETPSTEFVKMLVSRFFDSPITAKRLDSFKEYAAAAIKNAISDRINKRLRVALSKEEETQKEQENDLLVEESKIKTTEEELEAFRIVKAIVSKVASIDKIQHRDTQSYFGVLFDNNNRKPICRLYLDGKIKRIEIFDADKQNKKYDLNSIEEIYQYSDELRAVSVFYNES